MQYCTQLRAVSYTHLDVYKRQTRKRSGDTPNYQPGKRFPNGLSPQITYLRSWKHPATRPIISRFMKRNRAGCSAETFLFQKNIRHFVPMRI